MKTNFLLWLVGFPGSSSDKEPACWCRIGFGPWVGKIPWMTTHSNILAWRIPCTEEPGRLQPTGLKKSRTREKWPSTHAHIHSGLRSSGRSWISLSSLPWPDTFAWHTNWITACGSSRPLPSERLAIYLLGSGNVGSETAWVTSFP